MVFGVELGVFHSLISESQTAIIATPTDVKVPVSKIEASIVASEGDKPAVINNKTVIFGVFATAIIAISYYILRGGFN
jgi:hypothetical protein